MGNPQGMLLKPICNAGSCHLPRDCCNTRSPRWDFVSGERLEYLPEYFVQHLSDCLPLLIQPLLSNIVVPDWNRQESEHYDAVRCWLLADPRR